MVSARTNIWKEPYPSVGQSYRGSKCSRGKRRSSEANEGDQMHGWNTTEENGEVVIRSRHEAHRLYQKQLMYYTISRVFIDIPGIIVLYSFPRLLKQTFQKNEKYQTPHDAEGQFSPCL
jgi:hypothetical protein